MDNVNVNVQFVDNESEVILQIYDFRDLGYEYALYCGEKFIRCKECDRLIRPKTNNQIYCKECAIKIDNIKAIERINKLRNK